MRLWGWIAVCAIAMAAFGCGSEGGDSGETADVPSVDAVKVDAGDASDVGADAGGSTGPIPIVTILDVQARRPVPADLIFARLVGPGVGDSVSVEGVIRNSLLWVDVDNMVDTTYPLAAVLRDADGEVVFQRTLREPIQIREFLENAGVSDFGIDAIAAFPQLGDFAVPVPTESSAVSVSFELTEVDGSVTPFGEFSLADIPAMPPHPLDDAEVTHVVGDTPPEDAIDVAVVGDGYTADEMEVFKNHAGLVTAQFANIDPYATYGSRFNFYRIDVESNESGASYDCTGTKNGVGIPEGCIDGLRDTAFQSVFPLRIASILGNEVSDRAIFQLDQWGVYQVASKVPFDRIVVLVNTPKYGAFGVYHASLNALQSNMSVVAVHEFGHAFGLLGDEYIVAGDVCQQYELTPDYPNISPIVADSADVKWSTWMTPGVPIPTPEDDPKWENAVGLFLGAGGGCLDLARPKKNCLMRSSGGGVGMCPICLEQVIKRIYQHVDLLNPPGIRVNEQGQIVPDTFDGLETVGEWTVDGEQAGSAGDPLTLDAPASGAVEVEVGLTVREATLQVRMGTNEIRETITAKVRVEAP